MRPTPERVILSPGEMAAESVATRAGSWPTSPTATLSGPSVPPKKAGAVETIPAYLSISSARQGETPEVV